MSDDNYSSGKCMAGIILGLPWAGCSATAIIFAYNIIWDHSWEISLPIILGFAILTGLIIFCIGCFVKSYSIHWAITVMVVYECTTILALLVCLMIFTIKKDPIGDEDDDHKGYSYLWGGLILFFICGCCLSCLHILSCFKEVKPLPSLPVVRRKEPEEKKPILSGVIQIPFTVYS